MPTFNRPRVVPVLSSPIRSMSAPSARTAEGAPGFVRDDKGELFLLAVSNMVAEGTFYESARARDARYARLVGRVAVTDPEWTVRFLTWLRSEAGMRSAAVAGAVEAAGAMLHAGVPGGRRLVDAVLQRADEPGEALAYWISAYGRAVPKPVKRGIADAVARLYTERALLKYDTNAHGFRFGDVVELVHPRARAAWQGDLFRYALDRRHGRAGDVPASLPVVAARAALGATPPIERRELLDPAGLHAAGMTWEALAGWLNGPMDARAWQAVIPSMGYMALLRNLRNFDRAGVSDEVAERVAARLADPGEVARSRQFPLRFLSAYRAAPSLRWAYPLERALAASLANVPVLRGRTLVLVDASGSMAATLSARSTLRRHDAAALFGIALGLRCRDVEVVSFASERLRLLRRPVPRTRSFPLTPGGSLLSELDRWRTGGWFLGGGTETAAALRDVYAGHDRVVIVTDEQAAGGDVSAAVPADVPMYTWNVAGYRHGHTPSGCANRHVFGGFSDRAFAMIGLLEAGRNADWPF